MNPEPPFVLLIGLPLLAGPVAGRRAARPDDRLRALRASEGRLFS